MPHAVIAVNIQNERKIIMKKLFIVLITEVITFSLCSCKNENVKNVETMINSLGEITPESEEAILEAATAYETLTENEKNSVDNYATLAEARKTYDSFKKIYALTESNEFGTKATYTDYVYNEKGLITSYTEKGNGRPGQYTNEYDDKNNLITETRKSVYGTDVITHEYDESGLEVKCSYADDHGSINNGKEFAYTYTFDDKGRVATKAEDNLHADYTMVYSYTYNDDDTIDTETQTSPNSTYTIKYTYDENGNVIKKVSTNKDTGKSTTDTYKYECIGVIASTE